MLLFRHQLELAYNLIDANRTVVTVSVYRHSCDPAYQSYMVQLAAEGALDAFFLEQMDLILRFGKLYHCVSSHNYLYF